MNDAFREEGERRKAWLAGLKAGDLVVVAGRGWARGGLSASKVERVTKAQVVVDGLRYRRDTGRLMGERFATNTLEEPTPDRLATIRRSNLVARLERTKWADLPDETLAAIADALAAVPTTEEAP